MIPISPAERFSYNPYTGEADLLIQRADGRDPIKLSGEEAMYNTSAPFMKDFQYSNPLGYAQNAYNEANDNIAYRVGKMLRADSPKTLLGRLFDNSASTPWGQAGIGGLVGAGIGGLAGYLSDAFLDTNIGSIVPALIGAGVLGTSGYLRGKAKNEHGNMFKESAMYTNPRNIILEKLQASTTASPSEKLKLAEQVKNMPDMDARVLAKLVKEELTFSEVANVIGEFLNGKTWKEKLSNSMLANLCGNLVVHSELSNESDNMNEEGYNLGQGLAALVCGADTDELNKAAAMEKVASNALPVQALLCKAASLMLESTGDTASKEYRTFAAIADAPDAYDPAIVKTAADSAARALGDVVIHEKKASWLYPAVSDISALGAKTVLLSSLLGGAGLGALAWKFDRDAKVIDSSAEAKREQAKFYRNLAKDIKKQMRAKAISDAEKEHDAEKGSFDTRVHQAIKDVAKEDANFVI